MRRIISIVVALVLCLGLLPVSYGETQYPLSQGAVTDLAGVLGEKTAQDFAALSERLQAACGARLHVVTRHFLGGQDAAAYAQGLFDSWGLEGQDVLLLMVIGEENYALAVGRQARQALSADTQTSLLATHFRAAFLNRQYDEALAELAVQLAQTVAKAQGETLNVNGLFGIAAIQSTPKPQSSWSFFSQQDWQEEDWPIEEEFSSHSSFNWRGWLIWGLLIYFVFFRKKKRTYNFGHGPRRR